MAKDVLVRARGIIKEFGIGEARVRVLNGIDWEVAGGEMTFLVGESGSGKTTLISILAGILTPTAGEVEVLGTALQQLSQARLAAFRRQNVGFIFQQFNLLPTLSVVDNAAIPLLANGVPMRAARDRAMALLERLEIAQHARKMPTLLSGGQQQRVAIARALVHEPALLVCDEPTASLDARTGQEVMELLRAAATEGGRAVIVVTHDSRIFRYADRLTTIEDGRLSDEQTTGFGVQNA
jgi:putative ABC transport system ATP-binding protein